MREQRLREVRLVRLRHPEVHLHDGCVGVRRSHLALEGRVVALEGRVLVREGFLVCLELADLAEILRQQDLEIQQLEQQVGYAFVLSFYYVVRSYRWFLSRSNSLIVIFFFVQSLY